MNDPLVGNSLGEYSVTAVVGRGGMGAVYRAVHLAHRREVALKVLPDFAAQDPKARQRFQREIEIALQLEHPNIVPVYDAGYEDGVFFIAMRLVEGADLAALCQQGRLEPERAIRFLRDIARALDYVHRAGHVHRDVKPPNVLVSEANTAHEYAVLADFGIARALDSATQLTRGVIGTPAYLAPELVRWQPATPASDQYALACLAFELIAGRPPFTEDLPVAHLEQPPPPLSALVPGVGHAIEGAVQRGLRKEPGERFGSVLDFVAALHSRPSDLPASGGAHHAVTLRDEIVAVISSSNQRWVPIQEVLEQVVNRGRCFDADSPAPTAAALAAQVRRYPRIFRRDGPRVALVPGAERRLH